MKYNYLDKERLKIDDIDLQIIKLLNRRFKISLKIGQFKKKNKLPIQSRTRESQIIEKFQHKSISMIFGKTFIKSLFLVIFRESRDIQRRFDKKAK